jgi:hypothetical protein
VRECRPAAPGWSARDRARLAARLLEFGRAKAEAEGLEIEMARVCRRGGVIVTAMWDLISIVRL